MTKYNLTDNQKDTLRMIVEAFRNGKHQGRILSSVSQSSQDIIGIPGYTGHDLIGDLIALCDEGLLSNVGKTNFGEPICSLRQLGYDAVDNNFEKPELSPTIQNIGAIIGSVSGGKLQIVGYSENSEISQKFETKADFEKEIDKVAEQITEVVRMELNTGLLSYLRELEAFKDELKAEKPDESKLKKLLNTLGFFGNVEGTLSLILRVWPYLLFLINMVMNVSS